MSSLAVANGGNFALGVFLLTLAIVVLRRSPHRAARGVLAAFLALAGLNYALNAAAFGLETMGADGQVLRYAALGAALIDPPMLLLFALVVGYGPLPRLRRALVLVPALAVAVLFVLRPPSEPMMGSWAFRPLFLAEMVAYYLLAFTYVVDAYVRETRPLQRDRLGMLVLAFGVVCVPRVPLLNIDFGVPGDDRTYLGLDTTLIMVGVLGAMVAAVWLFLRVRTAGEPNHAHVMRTATALAGLCAAIAAQWALLFVPGLSTSAYSLLYSFRWFLFAAVLAIALQRHDLLDLSDSARRRVGTGFVGVLLVVAVAQLASILLAFPGATIPSALAGSAGIVAVVGAGYAAIRRATPAPPGALAWRRQTVYRTHLELGAPPSELAQLRERLGLSAREVREAEEMVELERAAPAPASDLEEGRVLLGRYETQRFLGAGGFGRVYLAWDRHAGQRVVLKELLEGWRESSAALERFRSEVETALRVDHPNLVGFRGLARTQRGHVLILEYVEGESLRDRIARGPMAPAEVARVAAGLLAGLEALHAAGIVHRDVKPDNVILRPDGRPVLLDFGAATDAARDTVLAAGGNPGTRAYMPPEQARGGRADPQADVYALGVTLWECLAGRLPPEGPVPPSWRHVLERAMAPEPSTRHAGAAALRRALPGLEA